MKKIVTKTAAALSGILMLFAAVSAGPGLAGGDGGSDGIYDIFKRVCSAGMVFFKEN